VLSREEDKAVEISDCVCLMADRFHSGDMRCRTLDRQMLQRLADASGKRIGIGNDPDVHVSVTLVGKLIDLERSKPHTGAKKNASDAYTYALEAVMASVC